MRLARVVTSAYLGLAGMGSGSSVEVVEVAENVPEVLVAGVALEALGIEESEEVPGARREVCPVAGVAPLALVPILPRKRP